MRASRSPVGATLQLCLPLALACLLVACGDDGSPLTLETPTTSCRTDLEIEIGQLANDYCVVADLTLNEADTRAVALAGSGLYSFRELAADTQASTIAFVVDRREISYADSKLQAAEQMLRFEMSLDNGEQMFGGGYLALSRSGQLAVGYTRASDFGGSVMLRRDDNDDPAGMALSAPGNFDVVWFDDTTLLVHGSGLGEAASGSGVYVWQDGAAARKLVDDLGDASSFLAAGPDVVYVGQSAWPNNRVYAFSRSEIEDALQDGTTLTTAAAEMVYDGPAADMVPLGNDLAVLDVTYDEAFMPVFNGVHRIHVTVENATVHGEETSEIIVPSGGPTPSQLASAGDLLGLLRSSDDGQQITIVRSE